MAITKYKVIQKNLEAVINYAKNGEKTEHGILVSGINCLPENAYTEMMLVKKILIKKMEDLVIILYNHLRVKKYLLKNAMI